MSSIFFLNFCERDLNEEHVKIDAKNYIIVTYQVQFVNVQASVKFAEQSIIFLRIIWAEW